MFLECSAKSAYNVEEAFSSSAKQILNSIDSSKSEIQSKGMKLENLPGKEKKEGGCC